MFARREFLKFVLGSAVAVGLPWKRFEWRTLRRRHREVAASVLRSNVLLARLVEDRSLGGGLPGGSVL